MVRNSKRIIFVLSFSSIAILAYVSHPFIYIYENLFSGHTGTIEIGMYLYLSKMPSRKSPYLQFIQWQPLARRY